MRNFCSAAKPIGVKDCYHQYIEPAVHFNNAIKSIIMNTFIRDQWVNASSKKAIGTIEYVPLWPGEFMEYIDSMKKKSSWLRRQKRNESPIFTTALWRKLRCETKHQHLGRSNLFTCASIIIHTVQTESILCPSCRHLKRIHPIWNVTGATFKFWRKRERILQSVKRRWGTKAEEMKGLLLD